MIDLFIRDFDTLKSQITSLLGDVSGFGKLELEHIYFTFLQKAIVIADDQMFGKILTAQTNLFEFLGENELLKIIQRPSISKETKLLAIDRFG